MERVLGISYCSTGKNGVSDSNLPKHTPLSKK